MARAAAEFGSTSHPCTSGMPVKRNRAISPPATPVLEEGKIEDGRKVVAEVKSGLRSMPSWCEVR